MPNQEQWMGVIRHILGAVGGYLTGAGYMDDAGVQAVIGAVMVVVPIIWSAASKRTT